MNTFRSACAAFIAAAGFAGNAGAQPLETGALLVAAEDVAGVTFSESVVLLIHHDSNGTLGLVINRPTRLEPGGVFPELDGLEEYTLPVYYGGPVAPTRPLLLLRDPPGEFVEGANGLPVLGDVFVTDGARGLSGLEAIARGERLRVYAGHAAWEPGQLDREVAAGDWHVMRGRTEAVFSDEPLELWGRLHSAGPEPELVVGQPRAQRPPSAATGATGNASRSALR